MVRKLRINYIDLDTQGEHAIISSDNGTYICTVEQCFEEGRSTFRSRARAFKGCLEQYSGHLIDACGNEV